MAAPVWRVLTASSVGGAHLVAGAPGEDAVGVWPPDRQKSETETEPAVAVAVADGHSDLRHFRSRRGAELAVEVAAAVSAQLAARVAGLSGPDQVEAALRTAAGPDLVRRWRDAVERDLADSPVTTVERDRAGLLPDPSIDDLIYAYGSTLVLAVAAGDWLLFAQIGDGDALVISDVGTVLRPLPPDSRLDGTATTSLCQPNAAAAMRYAVVNLAGRCVGAVMLATDGFGNAQVRNDWETAFGADLAALAAQHSQLWFEAQLPRWVARCASSDGSGDDVTVAMMFAADTAWKPPRSALSSAAPVPFVPFVPSVPSASTVDFGSGVYFGPTVDFESTVDFGPTVAALPAAGTDDATVPIRPASPSRSPDDGGSGTRTMTLIGLLLAATLAALVVLIAVRAGGAP